MELKNQQLLKLVVTPVEELKSAPGSWLSCTDKLYCFTKLQKCKLVHVSLKCKPKFAPFIPNIRLVSRPTNFSHKHILSKFHSEVGLCLIIRKKRELCNTYRMMMVTISYSRLLLGAAVQREFVKMKSCLKCLPQTKQSPHKRNQIQSYFTFN